MSDATLMSSDILTEAARERDDGRCSEGDSGARTRS